MITGKLAEAGSGMEEQFSVLVRPIMQQIIRSGFKFGRDGLSDAHAHSDREGGAWRRLFLLLGRLQRVNAQSRGAAKPMENSSTVSTVRPAGQLTTHDDQRRFVMRIIPRQLALFGHYRIVRTILQCNGSG